MKKIIIGIDVSKEKLDFCVLEGGKIVDEYELVNSAQSIKRSLKSVSRELRCESSEVLLCAEYTGQYTYPLCCACEELRFDLWLENPAQIKHSSGVQRGKNDRVDARRIAAYALRFEDKAHLFSMPEKSIASLRQLVSERDLYMSDKSKYLAQLSDQKRFMSKDDYVKKSLRLKRIIKDLEVSILEIEREIQNLIDNDETFSRQQRALQ